MKYANLPYSKTEKVYDDYGRHIVTGEKSKLRTEWERLAGTDDVKLTNEELWQIINNKNDAEFRKRFKLVLNEIEDCLYAEGLGTIENNHPELQNYPPFKEALKFAKENFKNLK